MKWHKTISLHADSEVDYFLFFPWILCWLHLSFCGCIFYSYSISAHINSPVVLDFLSILTIYSCCYWTCKTYLISSYFASKDKTFKMVSWTHYRFKLVLKKLFLLFITVWLCHLICVRCFLKCCAAHTVLCQATEYNLINLMVIIKSLKRKM